MNELAHLQNDYGGGIHHRASVNQNDDRGEGILNECMPVPQGRKCSAAASVQGPFLKGLAYGTAMY